MSYYTEYYNKNRSLYLTLAECWVNQTNLTRVTDEDKLTISKFFLKKAIRFGLVQEFRSLGII